MKRGEVDRKHSRYSAVRRHVRPLPRRDDRRLKHVIDHGVERRLGEPDCRRRRWGRELGAEKVGLARE